MPAFEAVDGMGVDIAVGKLDVGAQLLQPVFARPSAWRVLDAGICIVMAVVGLSLLRRLVQN